jgi:UDP-glucose 4-epimerase
MALVTGGAGFIGSHIVDNLVSKGATVRVLDNLTTGRIGNLAGSMKRGQVSFLKGNITDCRVVGRAVRGASTVFHEAALIEVPRSYKNPRLVHKVNVEGTINLLEASRRYDVERLVYASSSSVYGETECPAREDFHPRPRSPYAASKLAAEEYCQVYWRAYGLSTVSLRYFNVYGPRQMGGPYSGVISVFARAISEGRTLVVNGDGSQVRDFVHVGDVSDANVRAAVAGGVDNEVFNIGTGKATSIDALGRTMLRLSRHPHVGLRHAPARAGDVSYSCADITKAASRLAYTPRTEFEEGMAEILDWFGKKSQVKRTTSELD